VIDWGTTAKLSPVEGEATGGKLAKAMTEMYAPPPPAVGVPYALTLAGVGGGGPTVNTWQGDDLMVPDDWFTPANWSAGTVPVAEDVLIPTGLGNYPFIMMGEATCGALEVEAGAFIQLASDGYLTAGDCILDGNLSIMEGGSFISGGITGGGMFYMNRTLSSFPTGTNDGWHLLSSPLATSFTNWNMFDYYVNTWDETAPVWVNHVGSIPDCIPAAQMPLGPGMGWSVKFADWYAGDPCNLVNPGTGTELDFAGPVTDLNTGAKSIGVTYTNNATAYDGYNLVGNPYPSSIDADAIVFGGDLDGTVNIYNQNGDLQYAEWTTAIGPMMIAPTQGFFVRATAGTTFDLAGTERAHGGTFYKESIDNLLKLSVTGNDNYDETFVRFIEGTSNGYDLHLDASKMFASEDMPSLYTTSGGQQLAIDVQSATEQVPMSFSSTTPGTYSIAAFETSDFAYVYLQDLQTGEVTDLLAGSHEFTHTDGVQNFIIHFAPVGINDINANTVKIWALENTIMVNVPANVTGEIAVYNMMGQEVVRTEIESVQTQIPVSDVNTNYIVKVISNSNAVTGKVYVK
jgi:hypothetical protein